MENSTLEGSRPTPTPDNPPQSSPPSPPGGNQPDPAPPKTPEELAAERKAAQERRDQESTYRLHERFGIQAANPTDAAGIVEGDTVRPDEIHGGQFWTYNPLDGPPW